MQDIYDCTVQYIIENQNKFYRLAYSYVQAEQAALDVVQNAICRGLEGCYGLKNPLALKTWFYRIVVNESLQYLRRQKKETPLTEEHTAGLTYAEPAFTEDKAAYEAVMRLPEPMKTVVILHYYEDLTLKQIAEITETNLSTVKTRLYSALRKLRQTLKEEEK
ncbi:MAG: RNA polymerase sigma factor [Anaerotignum sp.]|nr:RNA polymerase sigma factor [Anaerotignum sp.]